MLINNNTNSSMNPGTIIDNAVTFNSEGKIEARKRILKAMLKAKAPGDLFGSGQSTYYFLENGVKNLKTIDNGSFFRSRYHRNPKADKELKKTLKNLKGADGEYIGFIELCERQGETKRDVWNLDLCSTLSFDAMDCIYKFGRIADSEGTLFITLCERDINDPAGCNRSVLDERNQSRILKLLAAGGLMGEFTWKKPYLSNPQVEGKKKKGQGVGPRWMITYEIQFKQLLLKTQNQPIT